MEAEIDELIHIIDSNEAKYDALVQKMGERKQPDLESRAMQAIALANRDPEFHTMFMEEVEGSRGFNFGDFFQKIGQGIAKIVPAIKAAVQKRKAAKAAKAKATQAAAAPAKQGEPAPSAAKMNYGMIIGVVVGLGVLVGVVYLVFFTDEEKAKK